MMHEWDDMITVGRIVRPHGIRGEVVVASETDFGADRFRAGSIVAVLREGNAEPVRIRGSFPHQGRWVLALEGVKSIEEAEALRGSDLKIPAGERMPLESGAYYAHDLVGCRVETADGSVVGVVRRLDAGPGTPLLAIEGPFGEVLVPLAADICRRVDVGAKVIVIDPPEGLLELNRAPKRG